MSARGRLVVISGPSGSGKTSIIERLRQLPHVVVSVSATTRRPRAHEVDGRDYHFLAREDFLARHTRGDFIETNDVFGNGHLYGSLWAEARRSLEDPQVVYLMELDVEGAAHARAAIEREGLSSSSTSIYIAPPSDRVLEERLRRRGTDDEPAIALRLGRAAAEAARARQDGSVVVTNHSIDQAVEEILRLLELPSARTQEGTPWTTRKS